MKKGGLFDVSPLDAVTRLTPRTIRRTLREEQACSRHIRIYREHPLKHAWIVAPLSGNDTLGDGCVFMRVPEGLQKKLGSPETAIKYITRPEEIWRAFPEFEEAEKMYWELTHLKASPEEYIRTLRHLKEIPTEVVVFRAKVSTVLETTDLAGSPHWIRIGGRWRWRKGGLGEPKIWFAILKMESREIDTRALEAITMYTTLPAKYFMRLASIGDYWELNHLPEHVPEEVRKYIVQQKPATIHELIVGYAMTGDRTLRDELVRVLTHWPPPKIYDALRKMPYVNKTVSKRIQIVLAEVEEW